jgi:hypothetical protein
MVSECARPTSTYYILNIIHDQILVGILRHYVVLLLQSPPKKLPLAAIREQYVLRIHK